MLWLLEFIRDFILNMFDLSATIRYRMNKKALQEDRYYLDYHFPREIAKLVEQAHRHESFNTEPQFSVSGEMRQKLMYPLTQAQVLTIYNTEHEVEESYFKYELYSHLYHNKASVSVTVHVTIDYRDTANGLDIHFKRVPVRITADRGEIVSVTHK